MNQFSTICFYAWAGILLFWSAVLAIATAKVFFITRQLERKIDLRNRWLVNRERNERKL